MPAALISEMTRDSTISNAWRVFRRCLEALTLAWPSLAGAGGAAGAAPPPEPAACRTVRLADAGWTDITVTTAMVSALLRDLGYEPHTTLLSVPVTFSMMKG